MELGFLLRMGYRDISQLTRISFFISAVHEYFCVLAHLRLSRSRSTENTWLMMMMMMMMMMTVLQMCSNNSRLLSDQTLSFIKSHPLMDRAVPAFGGQPLLVLPSLQ